MARDWNRNEVTAYFHKTAPEFGMESLMIRATNALVRSGIDTMEKLCQTDEDRLCRIRNMGEKSLALTLLVRSKYQADNSAAHPE